MSFARRFAATTDQLNFGSVDLSGGAGVDALTIHARLKFEASALTGSGVWMSQWGVSGVQGHGWMLGVNSSKGSRNVYWLLAGGMGNYDGTGTTGDPLTADGNYHSLIATWDYPVCSVWLDGVECATDKTGFQSPGLVHLDLNAAPLAFGFGGAGGPSVAGFSVCDVGFWRSALGAPDIALLAGGSPSCAVSLDTLLGFTDPEDTSKLFNVGDPAVTATATGTTTVSGPALGSPYGLLATASAPSVVVTQSVTIATSFGPYGSPGGSITLSPTATGGTLSPASGPVGTTFTFTAGTVPGPASVLFNNNGGLNSPLVALTIDALPAQIRSARVCKSGESILLQFERSADGTLSNLTAIANPTLHVNGSPMTLGTPIWLSPAVGQGTYSWALLTVRQPGRTVRVVDDLDTGFSAVGGSWQASSGWFYAYKSQHMHFTAGASDTASWTFTGLTPGTYEVAANWHAEPSFTAQARYTIHDGSNTAAPILATADRSHREGSQGLSTRQVAWSILGQVTISGSTLTVKVANVAGAGALVADATLVQPVTTPIAIAPSDNVTLTAPVGWATCQAGGVTPLSFLPVENAAGIPLAGEFEATAKRMQVGYNVEPGATTQMTLYSNLYKGTPGWGDGPNQDGKGNLLPGQGGGCNITVQSGNGVDNRFLATAPGLNGAGRWKLRYPAGPSGAFLLGTPASSGTTITVAVADHVATDGKREVEYDVHPGPNSNTPSVDLYCTGSTGHDIEVYGPDNLEPLTKALEPDPDHPFNPYFIQACRDEGFQVLRGLDVLAANNSACVDFADLPAADDDHVNPNSYIIYNTPPIVSIGPTDLSPANSDEIEWFGNFCSLKATFSAPHGLKTGQFVIFSGMPNQTYPAVNAAGPIADTQVTLYQGYGAFVWVRSPTTVIMSGTGMYALPSYSATPHTWNTVATPPSGQSWFFRVEGYKAGMPPAMFLDLCERVGATPYYNIPHLLSDAAVAELADVIFAALAPGSKIRFEWSNETWNFSFHQFSWCNFNGIKTGYGPYSWSGFRAAQVFAIIKARAVAAGRADDVIYVLGTQQGFAALTSYMISGANVFDPATQIDEVAGASYQDTVYMGVPVADAYINELDVEQMCDVAEASAQLATGQGSDLITHIHYGHLVEVGRTVLDENGRYVSGTRMIQYEGGPQSPVNNGYGPDNWIGEWSHAVYTHPRFRDIALAMLQRFEDQDIFVYHRFILNGHSYWSNGTCWGTYWGYYTQPGIGDGSDGKFDNRTNPEDPYAVSVFGGAMETWASLVGAVVFGASLRSTSTLSATGQYSTPPAQVIIMASMTNYQENKLIDFMFRGVAYTPPATWYVALYTAAPSDTGGGTEVTGGSYARVALASSTTNWAATNAAGSTVNPSTGTGGTTSNNTVITFPTATADWGTVTHVGLADAATAGNLCFWGALTASQAISNGGTFSFPISQLTNQIDN